MMVRAARSQSLRFNDTSYVDPGNNAALKLTISPLKHGSKWKDLVQPRKPGAVATA